jgi:hypothetical protein
MTLATILLVVRLGVYQGSQEYVSQPVYTEPVEIVFGKIEFESASEVLDSPFEFGSAQGCD